MELDNHTHPINKTLYAQYPQTRQPDEKKFHEMVSAVKNGATVTSTIRTHNNTSLQSTRTKDIYNFQAKLNKLFYRPKDEQFQQLLDEISQNTLP